MISRRKNFIQLSALGNYGFCVSRRMKEYVLSKENFMAVVLRHSRTWLILLPCLGLLTTASLTYGQSSEASDKYLKRGVSRLVKNDYDNAISDFDSALDGDFCTFVTDVYLPYGRENKRSYVHDEFRCKVLTDYFAGKLFSGITMLDVVRFIKYRLSTKIRRHNQVSPPTKLRSGVTVHKE